ncbi:MAG: hypothetical protein KDD60_11105, partial [Bdellovibrionales bacterium]|nr:hypothetical protein [Bdellovibrionales bacterium]
QARRSPQLQPKPGTSGSFKRGFGGALVECGVLTALITLVAFTALPSLRIGIFKSLCFLYVGIDNNSLENGWKSEYWDGFGCLRTPGVGNPLDPYYFDLGGKSD